MFTDVINYTGIGINIYIAKNTITHRGGLTGQLFRPWSEGPPARIHWGLGQFRHWLLTLRTGLWWQPSFLGPDQAPSSARDDDLGREGGLAWEEAGDVTFLRQEQSHQCHTIPGSGEENKTAG